MPRHVTQLREFLPTIGAFVRLIFVVRLEVVLQAADFAEDFSALTNIADENLVHTLSYWITVICHDVLTIINRQHIVL